MSKYAKIKSQKIFDDIIKKIAHNLCGSPTRRNINHQIQRLMMSEEITNMVAKMLDDVHDELVSIDNYIGPDDAHPKRE